MKDVYTNTPRVNCDNCGAVLDEGRCFYCGSTWFKPGMTLPNGGMVKKVEITQEDDYNDLCGGRSNKVLFRFIKATNFKIVLEIDGMSMDQINQLCSSLMETEPQLFRFQK